MRRVLLFCLGAVLCLTQQASAMILINEILADPPAAAGDANGDGVVSTSQDEFVEFINTGDAPVFLSGWTLSDALRERHVFPAGSVLDSHETLVVFSGGIPFLPVTNWQTASTGLLSLNNGGDTVLLKDELGQPVDQYVYGSEGGRDESLTRDPGQPDQFVPHSQADSLSRAYSPGESLWAFAPPQDEPDPEIGEEFPSTAAVPEPATAFGLLFGLGAAAVLKREKILA